MRRLLTLVLIISGIFLIHCKKDFSRRPVVTTGNFDIATAIARGSLVDLGKGGVTEHGFCWDSTGEPTIADQSVRLGPLATTGVFQIQLTTLKDNRNYHLKAFIICNEEILYGSTISFLTPDLPEISTAQVSEITESYAKCGGEVITDNGSPVLSRGICWGMTAKPDTNGECTKDGNGTGAFSSVLSGLTSNTQYFVRAYAVSIYGIRYGSEVVFNTGQSATTPLLSTNPITAITQTTATSGGNVVSDGGSPVVSRGVCWSTSPYPTIDDNKTEDGTGTGSYTSSVTGLEANTTYYLRAYATNEVGTAYGNEVSFKTFQAPNLPTVTTSGVSNITQTSATSGGTVSADGGSTVTARGVCWNTSTNPTTANTHTTDGTGLGDFVSSISGLTNSTKYYVRAYATNSAGTAYGNEISFIAGDTTTSPTIITAETINITNNSATSGGEVTSDGGSPVTVRGVCWSTSSNPTLVNNHTADGSGTGTFNSSLTELSPGTTYYVRAYATNIVGTSYGNERSFSTIPDPTPPMVTTAPIINVTPTTATSGGTVTNDGGDPVTLRGVCWSTAPNPTIANSHTTDGSGTGSYVSQITGLTANTLYYVRAYAINSIGTAYGDQLTFTTLQEPILPTVTTNEATNITKNTATSGGNVTSDGGSSVTARGVCWSTVPNPTLANNYTVNGSGTGQFISNLTELNPGTLYYVRAYATNGVGTSYGNEITFTTLPDPILPTVTTTAASNITQTTATSGGNVTSDGGATVTARGVCWSTSQNPTLANSHTSDGSGTGSFESQLTGLTANTPYYVRAYATNSVGTAYGNQISFTTLPNPVLPTVTTDTASNITNTSATSGGNVTSDGGAPVTARGVCWSTSQNPTIANSHTTDGSGTGPFISNLTGLTPNTFYYVKSYATNSVGTNYGNQIEFTTTYPVGTWTQKADFIGVERYEAACFSLNNKGYIGTGNISSNTGTKTFYEYDPALNLWTQKTDFMGSTRWSSISFSIGSKGYIGAGYESSVYGGDYKFYCYDPSSNSWTQKANIPTGDLWSSVGFAISDKGYVGTGIKQGYTTDVFYEYSQTSNSWSQKANFGGGNIKQAVGFAIGNLGYIGTGNTSGTGGLSNAFWEYNPSTNSWTQKANFGGTPRGDAVGFAIGNLGYIGTGGDGNQYCTDFWEYNPTSNSWIQKTNFAGTGRSDAVGFSIGTKGYVGTGQDINGRKKDFWEFNPN